MRSKQAFSASNRCIFEVSQEQYEQLLKDIRQDLSLTADIKPLTQQYVDYHLRYDIKNNDCVTWVLHKLDSIGIEVMDLKEWIPDIPIFDDLKELFPYFQFYNNVFLKFQAIDSNLESIKGVKAFKTWARTYINHFCFHRLYIENNPSLKNMDLDQGQKDLIIKVLFNVKEIYNILDIILQARLDKLKNESNIDKIKGDFEFIYWDRQANKIKSLKAENDYNPIAVENFDLNIPANNCSISKFYPFIFIPKDKILSRMLYHKYDYGKVSESYQKAANEFYLNVLAGIQSDKYWSESYHKLLNINKQFQTKEIKNA